MIPIKQPIQTLQERQAKQNEHFTYLYTTHKYTALVYCNIYDINYSLLLQNNTATAYTLNYLMNKNSKDINKRICQLPYTQNKKKVVAFLKVLNLSFRFTEITVSLLHTIPLFHRLELMLSTYSELYTLSKYPPA